MLGFSYIPDNIDKKFTVYLVRNRMAGGKKSMMQSEDSTLLRDAMLFSNMSPICTSYYQELVYLCNKWQH